jgi:histidinol-phosphate aminotransferase
MAIQPYIIERTGLTKGLLLDANEHYRQWVKLPYNLLEGLNRYPDNVASDLREALVAKYCKLFSPGNLLITSGSIEAIDLLMRSLRPEKLILNIPTYDVYSHCASVYGIPQVKIPYDRNGQPDVPKIIAEGTKDSLLVMVHPNNPTGQLVSPGTMSQLLDNFEGIIVVDEAYIEYAGMSVSMEQFVTTHSNLIILRTFSKAWGLAGLRIGYVIASAPLINSLSLYKNAYSVNAIALEAAILALDQVDELIIQVKETLLNKEELHLRLLEAGIASTNTSANFLLVNLTDALSARQALLRKGIITRRRPLVNGERDCLRVTIGSAEENDIFFAALIGDYDD